jgi:uncharacterized cupin superfamily protein
MADPTTAKFQRIPTSAPNAALVKTEFIKPEWVDSGAAVEAGYFYYNNDEKNVQVGFWSCSPFSETITFPYDEMGVVCKGKLRLADEEGREEVFVPGDVFFIPRNSTTTWHILEEFEQIYMIYAPRDAQYYKF